MRAWIYNQFLVPMTRRWYAAVLARLPDGARLLDVGIGTAGAVVANAATVRDRRLHIVGVDIDADYLKQARKSLDKAGLSDQVDVFHEPIEAHQPEALYDAIYFGASFMLMPDPSGVLRQVTRMLAPGGNVYFTQTFQEKRSPLLEKAKPMLHRVTTVQFGRVTYEGPFLDTVAEAGYHIVENERLGKNRTQSFRLVVARPPVA